MPKARPAERELERVEAQVGDLAGPARLHPVEHVALDRDAVDDAEWRVAVPGAHVGEAPEVVGPGARGEAAELTGALGRVDQVVDRAPAVTFPGGSSAACRPIAASSVADGLQAGRVAINAALFDDGGASEGRVSRGIEGLKSYRREWDNKLKTFKENPVKDWAEHFGSAWRYLGLAWRGVKPPVVEKKTPEIVAVPGQVAVRIPGPPEPTRRRRL